MLKIYIIDAKIISISLLSFKQPPHLIKARDIFGLVNSIHSLLKPVTENANLLDPRINISL